MCDKSTPCLAYNSKVTCKVHFANYDLNSPLYLERTELCQILCIIEYTLQPKEAQR